MAPTNSYGQEMVSIYLIKIKITTKFFNFVFQKLMYPPLFTLMLDVRATVNAFWSKTSKDAL